MTELIKPSSDRMIRAIELLDVKPDEDILEIGCGYGIGAQLICRRLEGGTYTGIDRSTKMIDFSRKRLEPFIENGVAELHHAELEEFDPGPKTFDRIVAIKVTLFEWEPLSAKAIVKPWLARRGRLEIMNYGQSEYTTWVPGRDEN